MGNFEKLSVLVIGVIIVMILVVALYTWTDDPAADPTLAVREEPAELPIVDEPQVDPDVIPSEDPEESVWWPKDEVDPDGEAGEGDGPDSVEPFVVPDQPADEPADQPAVAQEKTVKVKRNETLSHIALRELGKAGLWKLIADRNNIDNPASIREGMTLVIPVVDRAAPGGNKPTVAAGGTGAVKPGGEYTVKGGDTIQKIALAAFGTTERWPDIWFANFERIEDPRFLRQGMKLSIPN